MARRTASTNRKKTTAPRGTKTRAAKKGTKRPSRTGKTAAVKSKRKVIGKSRSGRQTKLKVTKKAVAPKKTVLGKSGRSSSSTPGVGTRPTKSRTAGKSPAPAEAPLVLMLGSERIELAEEERPLPKTKLTRKELRAFNDKLLAKRRELVGDVEHLTQQALGGNSSSSGRSHMPMHMADIGSDNWEQEFTLELLQNESALVREIDEALQRIEDRTYGICLGTHRPIDQARLTAKPWAKYCIEFARLRELGRIP